MIKHNVNSLPANWSVEKGKKETNKSCKNCHGVIADLGQIWSMMTELSQQLTNKMSPGANLSHCPKSIGVESASLRYQHQLVLPHRSRQYASVLFKATKDSLQRKRYDPGHRGPS